MPNAQIIHRHSITLYDLLHLAIRTCPTDSQLAQRNCIFSELAAQLLIAEAATLVRYLPYYFPPEAVIPDPRR